MAYTRKAIATRQRIITASADLVVERGFSRTRLEEILAASNVQKGNFYYYFRSKDELGAALLTEHYLPETASWLNKLMGQGEDAHSNLSKLPRQISQAVSTGSANPLLVFSQLALELAPAEIGYRDKVAAAVRNLASVFSEQFSKLHASKKLPGADTPENLGLHLLGLLQGAIFVYGATGDRTRLQRGAEMALIAVGVG